jgi:hypothetical protein
MNFKRWFSLGFLPDGEGGGSVVETKHDLSKMSGCIREALRQGVEPGWLVYDDRTSKSTACLVGMAVLGGPGIDKMWRAGYIEQPLGTPLGEGYSQYVLFASYHFGVPPRVVSEAEHRYMGWTKGFIKHPPLEVAAWLESQGY